MSRGCTCPGGMCAGGHVCPVGMHARGMWMSGGGVWDLARHCLPAATVADGNNGNNQSDQLNPYFTLTRLHEFKSIKVTGYLMYQ